MNLMIEAETAEELKAKILDFARVMGSDHVPAQTSLPIPSTVTEKKKPGRKPKEETVTAAEAATPVLPTPSVISPATAQKITTKELREALEEVAGEPGPDGVPVGIEAAKGILNKFGARMMSQVKEADYPAFITACKAVSGSTQAITG